MTFRYWADCEVLGRLCFCYPTFEIIGILVIDTWLRYWEVLVIVT